MAGVKSLAKIEPFPEEEVEHLIQNHLETGLGRGNLVLLSVNGDGDDAAEHKCHDQPSGGILHSLFVGGYGTPEQVKAQASVCDHSRETS